MIKELVTEMHLHITTMVRRGKIPLTRHAIKDFASMTSQELTEIIGNKLLPKSQRSEALIRLTAISITEKDLEDHLAK